MKIKELIEILSCFDVDAECSFTDSTIKISAGKNYCVRACINDACSVSDVKALIGKKPEDVFFDLDMKTITKDVPVVRFDYAIPLEQTGAAIGVEKTIKRISFIGINGDEYHGDWQFHNNYAPVGGPTVFIDNIKFNKGDVITIEYIPEEETDEKQ